MARKKYNKKYGCDMQALLEALAADDLAAFVAGLNAGAPDALERFERHRASLTKPRRVCVELFLCEGETFESIANRTGYLVDDVPVHIAAGVRQCMPVGESGAAVHNEAPEEQLVVDCPVEGVSSRTRAAAPRNKRRVWPWWVLAAAVVVAAAGAYLYSIKPEIMPQPVVEKPVPEPVVEPVVMVEEPLPDSVAVAKPVRNASIVTISRGEDGEYTSMPLIGRKQYNEYLSNAVMPLAEESRGEVTMTFKVNRYGRPSGIRVTSVLTHEANHEAIRLLANGPEWSNTEEQVSITILFP